MVTCKIILQIKLSVFIFLISQVSHTFGEGEDTSSIHLSLGKTLMGRKLNSSEFQIKSQRQTEDKSIVVRNVNKPRDLSSQFLSEILPEGDPEDYALPIFLEEPKDNFIVKSKAAELTCHVGHALSVHFQCNDEVQSQTVTENYVDPELGIRYTEAKVQVTRQQVEEFFGDYHCACVATTAQGVRKSRLAYVTLAFLKKEFDVPPYSDQSQLGKQIELRCHPPKGKPAPKIYWLRENWRIDESKDQNYIITSEGHLIIVSARLEDSANYTCVAENIAATRRSPPAELNIYVPGGWSSWSSWSSCSVSCGKGLKRRSRVCDAVIHKLDSPSPCPGQSTQKKTCEINCPGVDGDWSTWSTWSTCNSDCKKTRRRDCDNPSPRNGGHFCFGVDYDARDCLRGLCKDTVMWKDPSVSGDIQTYSDTSELALYIGLGLAVLVFLVVVLIAISLLRKRRLPNGYSISDSVSKTHQRKHVLGYGPDGLTEITDSVCYEYSYPDSNSNHSKTSYGKIPPSEHHYEQPMVRLPRHSPVDSIIKPLISDTSSSSTGGNISPRSAGTFDRSPCLPQSQMESTFTKWATVTNKGARLSIPDSNITLTVPEGCICEGQTQDMFLSVLKDIKSFPNLNQDQTLLSPIIVCGPQLTNNKKLKKSVILSFPHSASLRQGNWIVSVVQACPSEGDIDNLLPWHQSVTLGQETIDCPLYTQMDLNTCHIVTDSLSAFALLGKPQTATQAFKSMRIAAFGQEMSGRELTVRLYCTQDTDHALRFVSENEKQWGGRLLDKPVSTLIKSSGKNIKLQIERLGEGWSIQAGAEIQEVSFPHLWNSTNQSLHCSFTLRYCGTQANHLSKSQGKLQMQTLVTQEGNSNKCSLKINTNISVHQDNNLPCSRARPSSSGCSSNESYGTNSQLVFRLPTQTKENLSKMLDAPVSIGNDWRMLAERLSVHRYKNYFASRPSPTSALLDLWEARNRESSATQGLLNILRGMGRFDAAHLLEKDLKLSTS